MNRVVFAVLLLCASVAAQQGRNCTGNGRPDLDDWCDLNCNFNPPWCPAEQCVCEEIEDDMEDVNATVTAGCRGVHSSMFDDWCDLNCHYEPAFCPSTYCICEGEEYEQPQNVSSCRSVSLILSDSWCNSMCNYDPPFCPSQFCACDEDMSEDVHLMGHEPSCCDTEVVAYAIVDGSVMYQSFDQDTFEPLNEPQLCGMFLGGASDIAIDENQNIFVADQMGGAVVRINSDCTSSNVVTMWPSGPIDSPTAITIAHGGLYVTGSSGVYYVSLNDQMVASSVTRLSWTEQNVEGLSMGYNGTIYFIDHGTGVKMFDPSTGEVSVYFATNQYRIPDIKDIKVTENCGVFLAVTDSNQIWKCDDPMDGTTCHIHCEQDFENLDGSSCMYMNNPFGVTVDCQCRVYSAQAGNGNLVVHSMSNTSVQTTFLIGQGANFTDIEIYVNPVCEPPPTPSPSPTRAASPSPSPTRAASASPSITPSPSELFSMAIAIDDYNTECVVGQCGYNSTIALQGAETTRKFGVDVFIFSRRSINDNLDACDLTGDFDPLTATIRCRRRVDPSTFAAATPFVPSLLALFYSASSGGLNNLNLPPVYLYEPAVRDPEEFPNASPFRNIAAQVDCVGFEGKTFHVVWLDPLPCWVDEEYPQFDTCVPKRGSPASSAPGFVNAAGDEQPPIAPFKEILCPFA